MHECVGRYFKHDGWVQVFSLRRIGSVRGRRTRGKCRRKRIPFTGQMGARTTKRYAKHFYNKGLLAGQGIWRCQIGRGGLRCCHIDSIRRQRSFCSQCTAPARAGVNLLLIWLSVWLIVWSVIGHGALVWVGFSRPLERALLAPVAGLAIAIFASTTLNLFGLPILQFAIPLAVGLSSLSVWYTAAKLHIRFRDHTLAVVVPDRCTAVDIES